jgi:uncharacterized membrane protein
MLLRNLVAALIFTVATLWALAIVGLPRVHGQPAFARASAVVWVAGSFICHQRPERSFHAAGAQYPVCARCTGLYVAAPLGLLAVMVMRQRATETYRRWRSIVLVAAVPTAISIMLEQVGGPSDTTSRMMAALPLGAALAGFVGAAVSGRLIHYSPGV